mgnify:CR=1 FL=1
MPKKRRMKKLMLFNTLTRRKEEFVPFDENLVTYYHCGPTVYSYQHIGNYRAAYFSDLVVRTLKFFGYKVKFVTNITDVGHLEGDNFGDADSGEDRMEKAKKKEKKTSLQIAEFYANDFLKTCKALNLSEPDFRPRPTGEIPEQIEMVRVLLEKGHAYKTETAIYFDVSTFKDYGKLSGQKLEEKKIAVRDEIFEDKEKRNPQDFALWFFTVGRHKNHELRWESHWGEGFPGWHIECSAMGYKYLGERIDIHSGGKEHIPIHHENEIAQIECFTGKSPVVKYWLHLEHLLVNGDKMSKSLGNVFTVFPNDQFDSIVSHGFDPLDLRMFYLQSHYKTAQNFTWKNLESARAVRKRLRKEIQILANGLLWSDLEKIIKEKKAQKLIDDFGNILFDDFNTPEALAFVWKVLDEKKESKEELLKFLLEIDSVLGIDLGKSIDEIIFFGRRSEVEKILEERERARSEKDFSKSDSLRALLEEKFGVLVDDTKDGQVWWIK